MKNTFGMYVSQLNATGVVTNGDHPESMDYVTVSGSSAFTEGVKILLPSSQARQLKIGDKVIVTIEKA